MSPKRIGIAGYGNLGKYLTKTIKERDDLELAFIWNRSLEKLEAEVEEKYICRDLNDCSKFSPDIIVEVSHPHVTAQFGESFLACADFMIGSPTALADQNVEDKLRSAATSHGLYIPAGAFWGGEDILKMADRGTLKALKITMTKHPSCFKLQGELQKNLDSVTNQRTVLYDGPVRSLCPLAPNNVNTMAAAAMAAHNLGFDGVHGSIIADPDLKDWHIVDISVTGPNVGGNSFNVHTSRRNPADQGAVTGSATYASCLSSLLRASGKGPGVHLC